jgi:hypothetical protein
MGRALSITCNTSTGFRRKRFSETEVYEATKTMLPSVKLQHPH